MFPPDDTSAVAAVWKLVRFVLLRDPSFWYVSEGSGNF